MQTRSCIQSPMPLIIQGGAADNLSIPSLPGQYPHNTKIPHLSCPPLMSTNPTCLLTFDFLLNYYQPWLTPSVATARRRPTRVNWKDTLNANMWTRYFCESPLDHLTLSWLVDTSCTAYMRRNTLICAHKSEPLLMCPSALSSLQSKECQTPSWKTTHKYSCQGQDALHDDNDTYSAQEEKNLTS